VLLLDVSGSMEGRRLAALNAGLQEFRSELLTDPVAGRRVEIGIITFGGTIALAQDFITVDRFEPPTLTAHGQTPMGGAITTALDLVDARKRQYRENGISYYRPWIFMITDGEPTDDVKDPTRRLHEEEAKHRVAFFAVGVEDADMARLRTICATDRPPLMLQGLNFRDMFLWLSASMRRVSQSAVGDQVPLPPVGWAHV
jgi:uncharacterized protein YegL